MGCNGQPWCDAFIDDCFVKAYGREKAKELLGGFSNYTPTSAQYFKNMGRWHTSNPRIGDQIFKNNVRIYHTGLVYKVDSSRVYTIEGNTSGANGVIANGVGYAKNHILLTILKSQVMVVQFMIHNLTLYHLLIILNIQKLNLLRMFKKQLERKWMAFPVKKHYQKQLPFLNLKIIDMQL